MKCKWDTKWHECNTVAAQTTQAPHECYKNNTCVTQVKNFDFGNGTKENIILQPYIYCMANERLQD